MRIICPYCGQRTIIDRGVKFCYLCGANLQLFVEGVFDDDGGATLPSQTKRGPSPERLLSHMEEGLPEIEHFDTTVSSVSTVGEERKILGVSTSTLSIPDTNTPTSTTHTLTHTSGVRRSLGGGGAARSSR